MSGPRAAIARLSLALRVLLYGAFLVSIGYFGFSYGSGYVAVPGDVIFDAPIAGPPPQILAIGPAPGCLPPPVPPSAGVPGDEPDLFFNCPALPPDFQTFAAPPGAGEMLMRINENGADVTIRRSGDGDDAKNHISVASNGATVEREFTGTKLPDDIAKALSQSVKDKVEEFLSRPRGAPPMIVMRTGPMAPQASPPQTGGTSPQQMAGRAAPQNVIMYRMRGPALFQQRLRGNVGIRAALVGITIALVVLAMIQFERLLAHFQSAELFSTRNTGLMRNIGLLLVAIAIVQACATLLPAILARALHPIILGALGPHLFLVFAGLGLCLIAQVMAEASRLEDEAAHTV